MPGMIRSSRGLSVIGIAQVSSMPPGKWPCMLVHGQIQRQLATELEGQTHVAHAVFPRWCQQPR